MIGCIILNVVSTIAGSAAIGVACYATKSAVPLLAFLIIPKWKWEEKPVDWRLWK